MLTFKLHTDPGHGWLEVSRALLDELGIAERISGYSFQLGPKVYLEEDCDLALFLVTMKLEGRSCKIFEVNEPRGDSFVRGLPRFRV